MDKVFVDGMMFKKPHEKAPDFVKGRISVKVDEFIAFAKKHESNGWLNIDMKVSKGGKLYFELDTWQPNQSAPAKSEGGNPFNDDIPF